MSSKEGEFPHDFVDTILVLFSQLWFNYITIWMVSPIFAYKVSNSLLMARCHTTLSKLDLEHFCVEFLIEGEPVKMCLRHFCSCDTIWAALDNFFTFQGLYLPFYVCYCSRICLDWCYRLSYSISKLEFSVHLHLMSHAARDSCT